MMRRALLAVVAGAALAASLFVSDSEAEVPLAVGIRRIEMVAPGRVLVDVVIAGLHPELRPTIQGTATLGGHVLEAPESPVIAPHLPGVIDLAEGKLRIGGVSVADLPPVPPLDENTSVGVEVTVKQGGKVATARQTSVLLLPTLIVPGYLNDLSTKPDPRIVSILERRGYRAAGASPNLFWFTYPSRSLSVKDAARALATYVSTVMLPNTYAARINIVAHSLGGLVTRWNMAFEPGWDHLVNRFVMVGVPNEGVVLAYHLAWYPVASLARTPAARSLLPTFPFWRPVPGAPWQFPPDGRNPELEALNAHPLPTDVRAYAFYGNRQADPGASGTEAGITGQMPKAQFSYGRGDGIVLTASALGLFINGGAGVPGLADRFVTQVDLGTAGHLSLLDAAISKIADLLLDRTTASRTGVSREGRLRSLFGNLTVLGGRASP